MVVVVSCVRFTQTLQVVAGGGRRGIAFLVLVCVLCRWLCASF